MSKLYDKILEEEILIKDLVIPKHFPILLIDEYDGVYCYKGIIDNDRFLLNSSPYWLMNKKPEKIKSQIRGYFRIKNGRVLQDKKYIKENNDFNKNHKCKIIPAYVHFPQAQDMSYAIYSKKYQELENELTEKVFGLTYNDLLELLAHYNKVFKVIENNYYSRYPSITRSLKNNNFCDLSETWIPPEFPYIAFYESGYYCSHISLHGFYQHVSFLTQKYIDSFVSKQLIESGLNKEILNKLFNINDYGYEGFPINECLFRQLNNFDV